MGLEGAVKAAREQLQRLNKGARCAQAGSQKTCTQLADLEAVLESSEEEILHAAAILASLVSQGTPPYPNTPNLGIGPCPSPPIDLVTLGMTPHFGRLNFICKVGITQCLLRGFSERTFAKGEACSEETECAVSGGQHRYWCFCILGLRSLDADVVASFVHL